MEFMQFSTKLSELMRYLQKILFFVDFFQKKGIIISMCNLNGKFFNLKVNDFFRHKVRMKKEAISH